MPAFQSSEEPHRSGRAPPFGGCCVLQLGCVVMRQGKLDRQISCSDIWVFVYWCCMMIELRTCLNFTLICCSYWFHTEPRTKEKCNTANTDFSLSLTHKWEVVVTVSHHWASIQQRQEINVHLLFLCIFASVDFVSRQLSGKKLLSKTPKKCLGSWKAGAPVFSLLSCVNAFQRWLRGRPWPFSSVLFWQTVEPFGYNNKLLPANLLIHLGFTC